MRRAIALSKIIEFSAPGWIKKVEQLAPALPKRYKRIRYLFNTSCSSLTD